MNVPVSALDEIYDTLCFYNEKPKMLRSTFVDWYSGKDCLYKFSIVLNTLTFHCSEPFFCNVTFDEDCDVKISDEKFIELNEKLRNISFKYSKIKIFW